MWQPSAAHLKEAKKQPVSFKRTYDLPYVELAYGGFHRAAARQRRRRGERSLKRHRREARGQPSSPESTNVYKGVCLDCNFFPSQIPSSLSRKKIGSRSKGVLQGLLDSRQHEGGRKRGTRAARHFLRCLVRDQLIAPLAPHTNHHKNHKNIPLKNDTWYLNKKCSAHSNQGCAACTRYRFFWARQGLFRSYYAGVKCRDDASQAVKPRSPVALNVLAMY